ncbi:MAG TPA: hypothetical protein VHI93_08145, partial [Candidatus Thermoplasmatota archaeon]|nr:hypothetical protein [Candidatus Thermoplasmatota archaeon]
VMAISDGNKGLQVIQADPIPASRVSVLLSAPGRVLLNGAPGAPVVGTAVPLAAEGRLSPGDTFQVCTVLPVQSVEMVLRDQASGAVLERHTFASPAICTP